MSASTRELVGTPMLVRVRRRARFVGLGSFVRLQSLDENHVLVNDPARDSRALTKLTYEEARAMGYFATAS